MKATRSAREGERRAEEERAQRSWAKEEARQEGVIEKTRKLAKEQQLAAEREADEILRRIKEVEAEQRWREVGRRAREQEEKETRECLWEGGR